MKKCYKVAKKAHTSSGFDKQKLKNFIKILWCVIATCKLTTTMEKVLVALLVGHSSFSCRFETEECPITDVTSNSSIIVLHVAIFAIMHHNILMEVLSSSSSKPDDECYFFFDTFSLFIFERALRTSTTFAVMFFLDLHGYMATVSCLHDM